MDSIQALGSTLGLSFVAGIRLYATVVALGLAIRFGWVHLLPGQEGLRVLAEPAVIGVAAAVYLIEFIADKVPWMDSVWDSVHTFIRPLGAAILAATAIGSVNPMLKVLIVLLCGGVGFASHSSKAGTRLLINHSPEPFSNIAMSVAEDLFAPIGIWISLMHPQLTMALVVIFVAGMLWLGPKLFRSTIGRVAALLGKNKGNRENQMSRPAVER